MLKENNHGCTKEENSFLQGFVHAAYERAKNWQGCNSNGMMGGKACLRMPVILTTDFKFATVLNFFRHIPNQILAKHLLDLNILTLPMPKILLPQNNHP